MKSLNFRAWIKDEHRMTKVHEVTYIDGELHYIFDGDCDYYTVDEFKLMQSTGLKDVLDREVYEGDIIVTPFEEDGLLVVYLDTTAGMYVKNLLSGHIQFIDDPGSLEELKELKDELSQNIEIKGNIYENPELLGE